MSRPIPPILPILDVPSLRAPVAEVIAALAAGGARWIEYRHKGVDERRFYDGVREALEAARDHDLLLLVNDRMAVAAALGAPGGHLGQDDLPAAAARKLLGEDAILGLSAGTLEEAVAASREPVDYVAVGPVYATPSKADAGAPTGIDLVRRVRRAVSTRVMAIGGIGPGNAAEVTAAGADSVSAISALLAADDVAAATRALLEAAREGLRRRGAAP